MNEGRYHAFEDYGAMWGATLCGKDVLCGKALGGRTVGERAATLDGRADAAGSLREIA